LGDRRLKEIWNKTGSTATLSKFDYDYDVLGRIKQWTQQTDASTPNVMTMDYDNEDQLLGATITPQGQSVAKAFAYVYDAAGNRTGEQRETAGAGGGFAATGSAYNNVNQLTGRALGPVTFRGTVSQPAEVRVTSGANDVAARMTQDPNSASNGKIFTAALNLPAGNNTVTVVATNFALPTSFETTKNYQLTVVDMPAKTFAYDANGNLTNEVTAATTNGYSWDAEDRLVQITLFTNNTHFTSQFTYDGFGRRVQIVEKNNGTTTSTKNFVWSGRQLCEERDTANNVTKRFLAEGEQINGTSYYFTFDHLGSVREMTDSGGTIHARYDYDPYGRRTKVQGDLDADFGFTGYYVHQPSGLQLALYRAYDADLGRFINRDPIGEAGGLNLYDYVMNDPVSLIDPLGDKYVGNFVFLLKWLLGIQEDELINDHSNIKLQEMMNSPGANELRKAFYDRGEPDNMSYGYSIGKAARQTLLCPSQWFSTALQVGGFSATAHNNGDGTVRFTINNTAGTKSFFYHIIPDIDLGIGPLQMRSVYQEFIWTEPIIDQPSY
jgi:RHS repeat-associated protein